MQHPNEGPTPPQYPNEMPMHAAAAAAAAAGGSNGGGLSGSPHYIPPPDRDDYAGSDPEGIPNQMAHTDSPLEGPAAAALPPAAPAPSGLREEFHSDEIVVRLANRDDPNSPLYSVSRFEDLGLSPELLRGLYGMNFTKPSKIQEKALPLLLRDPPTNLIAQSQSGTGKTAAFALTMLNRVDWRKPAAAPEAVCLVNTRELAVQIVDVVAQMGIQTSAKITMAVKDSVARGESVRAHIVVGTPGTVLELARRRQLSLAEVRVLVLDEADAMLDTQALGEQSRKVRHMVGANAQVLLFSATFPNHVKKFATAVAPGANILALRSEEVKIDAIKQFYLRIASRSLKFAKLCDIYGLLTVGQSIIFVHTRATAYELAAKMQAEGHQVAVLTGQHTPGERDAIMHAFRSGAAKVLIATNVLARGIDVPQVNLVVNYDLPMDERGEPDMETYVHRIGRTGRFGRAGVAINFIDSQRALDMQQLIVEFYKMHVAEMPADYDRMEKLLREIRVS